MTLKEKYLAQEEALRDALRSIIAHYDNFGARTRGMDMILAECRKLLEIER